MINNRNIAVLMIMMMSMMMMMTTTTTTTMITKMVTTIMTTTTTTVSRCKQAANTHQIRLPLHVVVARGVAGAADDG